MVTEIKNIGKLWHARGVTRVAEAMVDNCCKKLICFKRLEATAGIQLHQAIEGAQLEETLKNKLSEAIDHLLTAEDVSGSASAVGAGGGQTLISVFKYLSQGDWAKIDASGASYWTIIYIVVERLKKIGLKSPMSEATTKWVSATLVANCLERTGTMPTYDAIYQMTKDLKEALKSCTVRPHPDLIAPAVYPESPDMLGDVFLKLAYENNDRPVERYSSKVPCLVSDHIPVRDTSKLLTKNQSKGKQLSAADVAKELWKLQKGDGNDCNIQLLSKPAFGQNVALTDASSPGNVSSPSVRSSPDSSPGAPDGQSIETVVNMFEPKLRMSKPVLPPPAEQLALTDGPTHEAGASTEKTKFNTAEDFENAAFNALTAGGTKKRPAAGGGTMKRPASAMGSEAKPKAKAKKGSLQLGCKSCRGSPNGCKSCRNPNFAGWRGTAKEFYAQGGKAPN